MSTQPCTSFHPHLWKVGYCRDCAHPETAHQTNTTSNTATSQNVTNVSALASKFGGSILSNSNSNSKNNSQTNSPQISQTNSKVNSPKLIARTSISSMTTVVNPTPSTITAATATTTSTTTTTTTFAANLNKVMGTPSVGATTSNNSTAKPLVSSTNNNTTIPSSTPTTNTSSSSTTTSASKNNSSPSTPTSTACTNFEAHKFLPNKCINCPFPKSEHPVSVASTDTPTTKTTLSGSQTTTSPSATPKTATHSSPIAAVIGKLSPLKTVEPVNTSSAIKTGAASPPIGSPVVKSAAANIANIFKQQNQAVSSPTPTASADNLISPKGKGTIADRMSGLKLYSPSNPPMNPFNPFTPKREVVVSPDSADSNDNATISTPTSGSSTISRAKMATPRSRPSRPSFTPMQTSPTEGSMAASPIKVVSPSQEKAVAESEVSTSTSDSASESQSQVETEAETAATAAVENISQDVVSAVAEDFPATDKDSGATSAAVNFFTDGFKVDTTKRPSVTSESVKPVTSNPSSATTSRPASARSSLFGTFSNESPTSASTTSTSTTTSNVKPVSFVQSEVNPLLPKASTSNENNTTTNNKNNDDDDDDDGLFITKSNPLAASHVPSLSALAKNVDFLDFEDSNPQNDDESNASEKENGKSISVDTESTNATKAPASSGKKANLFFSPLSAELPKGVDDTPVIPTSNSVKSSPSSTTPPAVSQTKSQPLFFGLKSANEQKNLAAEQADRAALFSPNSIKNTSTTTTSSSGSSTPPNTASQSFPNPTVSASVNPVASKESTKDSSSSLFDRPAASNVLTDVLGVQVSTRRNDLFD